MVLGGERERGSLPHFTVSCKYFVQQKSQKSETYTRPGRGKSSPLQSSMPFSCSVVLTLQLCLWHSSSDNLLHLGAETLILVIIKGCFANGESLFANSHPELRELPYQHPSTAINHSYYICR